MQSTETQVLTSSYQTSPTQCMHWSPSQPLGPESGNAPLPQARRAGVTQRSPSCPHAWGRGALRDSSPSSCDGDYVCMRFVSKSSFKFYLLHTVYRKLA